VYIGKDRGELVRLAAGGDVNGPVIVGRLYNDEDRPPANEDGKAVLHLPAGAADSDAVHHAVRWRAHERIATDRPVRLRFHLRNASLYGFRVLEGR